MVSRENPRRTVCAKKHLGSKQLFSQLRAFSSFCSFVFSIRSFIRRVRVSRSHARVPFTRQTGLRFLRATALRRMSIFAIYTAWEPNLHHYPDELTVLGVYLACTAYKLHETSVWVCNTDASYVREFEENITC